MRIAYVCMDPGVPVFGVKGCSVHVQEVVRAFKKRGDEVELFATRYGGPLPLDLKGMTCHRLPLTPRIQGARREMELIQMNEHVEELLDRSPPFDVVYERYSLFGYGAMRFARRCGAGGILEVNSPLIAEQKSHRTLCLEKQAKAISGRCLEDAQSVIAVSETVANYLRRFPKVAHKTSVVANGVNVKRFQSPMRTTRKNNQPVVIGFVGTLKPWHGANDLIEAFSTLVRQFPPARLRIIGDGPMRESVEQQVDRSCPRVRQSVELLGAQSPAAIPALLAQMDIAVAPYPALDDFYFSPLKIFEYMAAGLPVVASRIGQICNLVQEPVHGLLYEPGNIDQLARSLGALCRDPRSRQTMGAAGRKKVEQHHTWDAVVQRTLSTLGPPATHATKATP